MANVRFRNRDAVIAKLKALAPAMIARVQAQGDIEIRTLANAVKAAAPVGTNLERHPGELRDSVHSVRDARPLKWRVVIDAKDLKGRFIARPVEFGHRARNGVHVPPVAFAYPTVRVQAPGIRRRMAKAARDGARAAVGDLLKG